MGSIADLPPELLCQIFEFSPNFSTITPLTLTSRLFHDIWLTHSQRIATAVTPRVISNLTAAEALAAIQEENVKASNLANREEPYGNFGFSGYLTCTGGHQNEFSLAQAPSPHQKQEKHAQVVSRVRRLLHNARLVSLIYDSYVKVEQLYKLLLQYERIAFRRPFYHLWTLCLLEYPKRTTFLGSLDLQEYKQLRMMAGCIKFYGGSDDNLVALGLDFKNSMWRGACDAVQSSWTQWMREDR